LRIENSVGEKKKGGRKISKIIALKRGKEYGGGEKVSGGVYRVPEKLSAITTGKK